MVDRQRRHDERRWRVLGGRLA